MITEREWMEVAVYKCTQSVLADKPKRETRWQMYRWHRRWRNLECELYHNGGMYGTINWYVLKATLGRIGGFW